MDYLNFVLVIVLTGAIISMTAPFLGQYLVIKRMSHLTDTLAHISLFGIAVSLYFNFSPVIGAFISTLISGFWIELINKNKKYQFQETVLTLFLYGGLGLSSLIISLNKTKSFVGLNNFLFGNVNTVGIGDLIMTFIVCFFVLIILFGIRSRLFLSVYIPEIASSMKIKVGIYNLILTFLSSLLIAVGVQILGVLLVGGLLIIPVLIGMELGLGFFKTSIASSLISVSGFLIGFLISFNFDVSTSGAVISTLICFYIIAKLITFDRKRGNVL